MPNGSPLYPTKGKRPGNNCIRLPTSMVLLEYLVTIAAKEREVKDIRLH